MVNADAVIEIILSASSIEVARTIILASMRNLADARDVALSIGDSVRAADCQESYDVHSWALYDFGGGPVERSKMVRRVA